MDIQNLQNLELTLTVELGRVKMTINELLKCPVGSLIQLNTSSDKPLNFYINNVLAGTCEVVTNGNQYGIKIIEKYNLKNKNKLF